MAGPGNSGDLSVKLINPFSPEPSSGKPDTQYSSFYLQNHLNLSLERLMVNKLRDALLTCLPLLIFRFIAYKLKCLVSRLAIGPFFSFSTFTSTAQHSLLLFL